MLNDDQFIGFYLADKEYGYFSNWYPSEFEYAGIKYANVEQFMMYQKMMTFNQLKIADRIHATADPGECKNLGRTKIDNWNGELWDKISYTVVKRGIKAKFIQNPKLRRILLDTGDMLLAECSEKDTKWGIGISIDNDDRFDVSKWKGKNYLGRILMEVRDELRKLVFMTRGSRQLEYRDAHEMNSIPEWRMTIGELLRMPKYHNTVSAYKEVIRVFCRNLENEDINELIPDSIEYSQRYNMGGGLPHQGFWELKQDFYELANNMWVLSSGFDAPAIGNPLPEGAKLVKNPDGTVKIIYPDKGE